MKINVGSKNPIKLAAVKEALQLYPQLFKDPEIAGIEVGNATFGHPGDIEATVAGAISRAKEAFQDCDLSFGLEGGLLKFPFSNSGYMEVTVCAIYNGKRIFLGLGPGFEWPKQVTRKIVNGEADASLAFKQLGLTTEEKLGAVKGGITGFLTEGRLTREDALRSSIITALIYLEKPELAR